ncbi:MAG: biopolymer transporter ExbB [Flavobacteriales bacterium]|nr:biopolymer transporter ExbB [Flavobacteriales bacterium]|tara:strand:+ start:7867 stop:8607 length:741 start_codon:yes stop_codon:yes gene_type:complete
MLGNLFKLQLVETGNVSIPSSSDSTITAGLENTSNVTSDGILIIDLIIDSWPIMLPLFVLSIIAVYIWVERYNSIKKASKIDASFMSNLKNNVSTGKIEDAKTLCADSNTPVARMLHKGILRLGRPLKDISTSIENVANLEISNMEKNLSILATISGAAPMIGFLGTVLGMMNTFHKMSAGAEQSSIHIGDLSEGIMYAMTTTVAGLIVGIVAYLGYNLLVSKVDKVVHKMEDSSLEFMDLLNEPG